MCSMAINCFAHEPQQSVQNESDGIIGGHEYVDLGLPSGTLWATYNVGATSPYEKGYYFAWVETETREEFSRESYKFFQGYKSDPNIGSWTVLENIGADICGTEYDAARYHWGNGWRLPNEQERYELCMLCWTNGSSVENGVRGVRLHGPNEHSIFLPICGFGLWYGEMDPFHNTSAAYWTGSDDSYNGLPIEPSIVAKSFAVERDAGFTGATSLKAAGLNIRAVINPIESGIDNVVSNNEKVRLTYYNGCIHVLGNHSHGIIKVFDLCGRMIYSGSVVEGSCQLPVQDDGIYLISYAHDGSIITTQKITIK